MGSIVLTLNQIKRNNMHLIDKDPMTPEMKRKHTLNMALRNKISPSKYTTNPLLKMVPPKEKAKPVEVQIRTTSSKKPQMKQYGDKGYKPATGSGTGN